MLCPDCKGKSEAIDSRQLTQHRYRRYRCLKCGTRYSTAEFIVAVGNSAGGHPVQDWLIKMRTEGAAQLVEKLDALLTTWRKHGSPKDPKLAPGAIAKSTTQHRTPGGGNSSENR